MGLFPEFQDKANDFPPAPLADRMRPRELKDLIGQTNLIGKGKPLCKLITGKSFPVPDHLKDTHYSDAKARYGYGKEYKYPHDYPNSEVIQDYLPDALKGSRYVFFNQKKIEGKL